MKIDLSARIEQEGHTNGKIGEDQNTLRNVQYTGAECNDIWMPRPKKTLKSNHHKKKDKEISELERLKKHEEEEVARMED